MFKEKVSFDYVDPVTVSARFTYQLKQFPNTALVTKRKFPFADRNEESLVGDSQKLSVLPFGVSLDPVRELILYCTWPEVAENVVMDSRAYTDFDPMLAPNWSFRLRFEAVPICFMCECIHELLQQSESTKMLSDILGIEQLFATTSDYNAGEEANPLERLTESKISRITSSVLSVALPGVAGPSKKPAKKARGVEGPLREEQLMEMLYYLFPDAQADSPHAYPPPEADVVSSLEHAESSFCFS